MNGRPTFFHPNAIAVLLLFALAFARPALAGPDVDLHELSWYVHVDVIDVGAGRDLAFWEAAIDAAVSSGNDLLEGPQGPVDAPCCTRITRNVSVTTFGSTGDGLDVVDSLADQNAIGAHSSTGSAAYLVDSITYCGGSQPLAIGCAVRPGCDGDGSDDPDLWMIVTVESYDDEILAAVLAHERGHNACLQHDSAAECQLMQSSVASPGLGGCLLASECSDMQAGRTTTSSGLSCTCQDVSGTSEADGTACAEVAMGVCSGGLCGDPSGDASVQLLTSAAPGVAAGGAFDDAVLVSALKGEWSTLGAWSVGSDEISALAHATDSNTTYGIVATSGDDSVVTVDASTGAITATVGAIANGTDTIVGMAYDPGATSATSDDRLVVLEVTTSDTGEFREIDPASPNTATFLGSLGFTPASLFSGLAYDSVNDLLYIATPFSPAIWQTDLSNCPACSPSGVAGTPWFRSDASLAYSADTQMLYLMGTSFGGTRTFYNVIDPATWTSVETLSLDLFQPAGLAVLPAPSPPAPAVPSTNGFGLFALAALLLGSARAYRRFMR